MVRYPIIESPSRVPKNGKKARKEIAEERQRGKRMRFYKKEDNWFCLLFLVVVIVVGCFIVEGLWFSVGELKDGWMRTTMLILGCIGSVSSIVLYIWRRIMRWEWIFGFRLVGNNNNRIAKEQERVDFILQELAKRFHYAAKKERELQEMPKIETDVSNQVFGEVLSKTRKIWRHDLKKATEEVSMAKTNFWHAHGLAKKYNFEVKKSFTQYLS